MIFHTQSHTQVGLGEDIYDDDKANFGKSIKQLDPSAKWRNEDWNLEISRHRNST